MKRSFFLSSYSVTVRVKNYEAGVRLHQIRFAVKACLTGTGTAADKGVQIAAVFLAVESDTTACVISLFSDGGFCRYFLSTALALPHFALPCSSRRR